MIDDLRHLRPTVRTSESLATILEIVLGVVGGVGFVWGVAQIAILLAR